MVDKMLRTQSNRVINISLSFQITAITVTGTFTVSAGILLTGLRRSLGAENPNDCPNETLCAQCRTAVPKTEGAGNKQLTAPTKTEKDGLNRVK